MQPILRVNRSDRRSSRGISLVELMIGLVVGLIITLAITSSVGTIGKQFRITGAGHAAAEGAQVAVAMIDQDLRGAGAALFNGSFANLCPGFNMYDYDKELDKPVVTNNANLYGRHFPVRIEQGEPGTSDLVDIMVGPPDFYLGAMVPIAKEMPAPSDVMKIGVSDPNIAQEFQLRVGDIVLVVQAPPNSEKDPCTRMKVTKISGKMDNDACTNFRVGCTVHFGSTKGEAQDFNPAQPTQVYVKAVSYSVGSLILKMPPSWTEPQFKYRRYAVDCGKLLRYDWGLVDSAKPVVSAPDIPSLKCLNDDITQYPNESISGDIVMLKAQYGISTDASDLIAAWENAPTTAEYKAFSTSQRDDYFKKLQRVKAVRMAIVARSREPDSGVVTAQAPRVFDGTLTLNLAGAPVAAGKNWQNYRYRVHETVVPLRNPLWNR